MKTSRVFALVVLLMVVLGMPLRAASAHFANISPEGARISALVVDPSDPSTLYAATAGGIFKSVDGGERWTRAASASDSLANRAVDRVAIDPAHPATLYAASVSGQLLKTVDGGATWTVLTGFQQEFTITAVVVDPSNSDTIYATTYTRLQKSTDGGMSWRSQGSEDLIRNGSGSFLTLAIDPHLPARLYLGSQRGLFVSNNGGEQWSLTLFGGGTRVQLVAVDPNDSTRIYAAFDKVVLSSRDAGKTWGGERLGNVTGLAVDPATSVVYALADGKTFTSSDHGLTWKQLSSSRNDLTRVVFDGSPRHRLFAASHGDILRSDDGGTSWLSIHQGLNAGDVTDLIVDFENPSNLIAATGAGLTKSSDSGAHWTESSLDFAPAGLAADAHHPSLLFAFNDDHAGRSDDAGGSWSAVPLPVVRGVAIDPTNPAVTYAALAAGVAKSMDAGGKWGAVFTEAPLNYSYYGFEGASVAVDPIVPSNVYAAGGGTVIKSSDGGASWRHVISTNYEGRYFLKVVVDPSTPSTVYAASVNNVYRSDDAGETWRIVLPDNRSSLTNLSLDPVHTSTLYLATRSGVRRSFDRGEHWESFDGGLPGAEVHAVAVDRLGNVYAATAGGLFVSHADPALLQTATSYSVSLRSDAGNFVSAANCGGAGVNANQRLAGACETFTLFDLNAGDLHDGDAIHLRAADGAFVASEGGGGSDGVAPLNANRDMPAEWETFVIHKAGGSGAIAAGDVISLQAWGGRYVAAEGGGANACQCDSFLNANRSAIGAWERFVLVVH